MGLLLTGASGSGKTTLVGLLALQLLRLGYPAVCLDPTGTLSEALLSLLLRSLQHVPLDEHAAIWRRIRYIDVGNPDVITPFPIYYRREGETLREVAERFIDTLRLANPNLVKQASVTWPSLRRVGINTGMVLASLGFQLTEAEDLLFNTLDWEKSGLLQEAINRNPEAAPAVRYFRESYLPLSRSAKNQLTSAFLDHVFTFALDPKLQLLFGASTPGLDLDAGEEDGEFVILDCKHVTDPEARRFVLLWIFQYLFPHIKARGRRQHPLGLLIDEFAELAQPVTDGVNPLAVRFDEFIQRYMRNHRIFFACAFQSINQIDHQLRNTVLSLGNMVVGHTGTMEEARVLADVLFRKDPMRIKNVTHAWGRHETPPWYSWRLSTRAIETGEYFPLEAIPHYMSLDEQHEEAAIRISRLGLFHFLCRPALREGEVSEAVIPISIERIVRDKKPGSMSLQIRNWSSGYAPVWQHAPAFPRRPSGKSRKHG
jgi:hypothetical protein